MKPAEIKDTILFVGSNNINKQQLTNYIINGSFLFPLNFKKSIPTSLDKNVHNTETTLQTVQSNDWEIKTKYYSAKVVFMIKDSKDIQSLDLSTANIGAVVYAHHPLEDSFDFFKKLLKLISTLNIETKLFLSLPTQTPLQDKPEDCGFLDSKYEDLCLENFWEFVDYEICCDDKFLASTVSEDHNNTLPSFENPVLESDLCIDKTFVVLNRAREALVSTLWMTNISFIGKNTLPLDPNSLVAVEESEESEWDDFQEYKDQHSNISVDSSLLNTQRNKVSIENGDDLEDFEYLTRNFAKIRDGLQNLPREERLKKAEEITLEFTENLLKY
ncbi:hypothetical protein BB561_000924 [Smittium simulii]|uniref:Uncharacterized protein n=1 Tax=Smittium simulii TaxID=133385 RepID=A0A2T9YWY6_9FUNG|nr:hypothetical protein BB561_000924 [Smittium simulii]